MPEPKAMTNGEAMKYYGTPGNPMPPWYRQPTDQEMEERAVALAIEPAEIQGAIHDGMIIQQTEAWALKTMYKDLPIEVGLSKWRRSVRDAATMQGLIWEARCLHPNQFDRIVFDRSPERQAVLNKSRSSSERKGSDESR